MKTQIILLRAVTPTGKNKVPMARLRAVLTDAGFKNVRTYITSGNALVESDLPPREIEKQVHGLIKEHIGPDLAVVVRTGAELQTVLDENPFTEGYDLSHVFFASFASPPPDAKVNALLSEDFGDEKLVITGYAAYIYTDLLGRGRLSNNFLEKKLGVAATTRNFNTMKKLVELSRE
jgi:uncharacterized protein (DUF1697 family)